MNIGYLLEQVGARLRRHGAVYLILALIFALGCGIFISEANTLLSNQKRLLEAREENVDKPMGIYYGGGHEEGRPSSWPVTYNQYRQLAGSYADELEITYQAALSGAFFLITPDAANPEGGDIEAKNIYFVFMDDARFEQLFGQERVKNTVYGLPALEEELRRLSEADGEMQIAVTTLEKPYALRGGVFSLDETEFAFQTLPENTAPEKLQILNGNLYTGEEQTHVQARECLILPLEAVQLFDTEGEETRQILLTCQFRNANYSEATLPDIIAWLSKQNPSYRFELANDVFKMQDVIEELNNGAVFYLKLSVSILLIASLGVAGILYIYLHRRRKELAVAAACGATQGSLFTELFLELFAVLGSGGLLGFGCAALLKPLLTQNNYFDVQFHPVLTVWMAGICILLSLLLTAVLFQGLIRRRPIEVLREG